MNAHEVVEALTAIAELGNFAFEPGEGFAFSLILSDGTEVGLDIDPTVDQQLPGFHIVVKYKFAESEQTC